MTPSEIEAAIRTAVEAEREACAQVAEEWVAMAGLAAEVARCIRARGKEVPFRTWDFQDEAVRLIKDGSNVSDGHTEVRNFTREYKPQ